MIPDRVTLVEMGPRDGLQNIDAAIPTDAKIRFVDALTRAGLPVIEVGAFVSPKAVPQMADSADVFAGRLEPLVSQQPAQSAHHPLGVGGPQVNRHPRQITRHG